MLRWKSLTGKNVLIKSDLLVSTVVYPLKSFHLSSQNETISETTNETINETIKSADEKAIIELLKSNSTIKISGITTSLGWSKSKINRLIASLKKRGVIKRVGSNKGGHWEISTVVYPLKSSHLSSQNETINETTNETINETIKSVDEKAIIELLKSNSTITVPEITASSGWSKSKINRLIASLKKRGVIKRVGSNKGGHWEISTVVYPLKSSHLSSQNEGINEE